MIAALDIRVADGAGFKGGQKGGVPDEHAELAQNSRRHDDLDVFADEDLFGRDDFQFDSSSHKATSGLFCGCHFFRGRHDLFDAALHIESLLGMSSCLPSQISLKPRIVSSSFTYYRPCR